METPGDKLLREVEEAAAALPVILTDKTGWHGLEGTPFAQKAFDVARKAQEAKAMILGEATKQLHALALLAQHSLPAGVRVDVPTLDEVLRAGK